MKNCPVFKLVYWTTVLDTTFSFVTFLYINLLQSSDCFRIILCNFLSYPISYTLSTFLFRIPPHIF